MKVLIRTTTLSLLLLLFLLSAAPDGVVRVGVVQAQTFPAQTQTALIARLQTSKLNELIDVIKQSTLPRIIQDLNARGTIRDGDVEIAGFSMDTNNLDVSIDTSWAGSFRKARISINVKNVRLDVSTLNYKVADNWLFSCTLRYDARVTTPRFSMSFVVDIPNVSFNQDIRLSLENVDSANLDVDLDANGSGLCGLAFSTVLGVFVDAFDSLFDGVLEDVIEDAFQSVSADTITLTEYLGSMITRDGVDIGFVAPLIKVDKVYSSATALTLGLTTSLGATMFSPDWRRGRSYKPQISNNIPTPPEEDIDVQALVTFDTINALLAVVWYIGWGIISDDPASDDSTLCEATQSDECPFPPYLEEVEFGFFSLDYWVLMLNFLFSHGFLTEFLLEAVVEPPLLDYEDGRFSGTGRGKLLIRGGGITVDPDTALAQYELELEVETAAPAFEQSTGALQGFRVLNFDINALTVDVFNEGLFGFFSEFRMNRIFGRASQILSEIVDLFLPIVNEEVEKALRQTPLVFPAIKNFPLSGQTTKILLSNTRVGGTNKGSTSFIEAASDVSLTVDNNRREL